MGSYLDVAKHNIKQIGQAMSSAPEFSDVRVGTVYWKDCGDHALLGRPAPGHEQSSLNGFLHGLHAWRAGEPVQPASWNCTAVQDLTADFARVQTLSQAQTASGGGDIPEAATTAINDVLNLSWRSDAIKVVVFITDAPPHGLQCPGDRHPEGDLGFSDPKGKNLFSLSRMLVERGIVAYFIAAEPLLSQNPYALDYFTALAELSGGKAFPITNAVAANDPLQVVAVIKAAAVRSAQMAGLAEKMHTYINEAMDTLADQHQWGMSWHDIDTEIAKRLHIEGFLVTDFVGKEDPYSGRPTGNVEYFKELMRNQKRAALFMAGKDLEQPRPVTWTFPDPSRANTRYDTVLKRALELMSGISSNLVPHEVQQSPTAQQIGVLRRSLELRRDPSIHPEAFDD